MWLPFILLYLPCLSLFTLLLYISFALAQSSPVINVTICASTNAAQNRLLMPQMNVMVSNENCQSTVLILLSNKARDNMLHMFSIVLQKNDLLCPET